MDLTFREINTTNTKKAVAAIITNARGELLGFDHLKLNMWAVPTGKVDDGETPDEAIRREVREEIGIEFHRAELVAVLKNTTSERLGTPTNYIIYLYELYGIKGKPINKEPHKHANMGYKSLTKLAGKKLTAGAQLAFTRPDVIWNV